MRKFSELETGRNLTENNEYFRDVTLKYKRQYLQFSASFSLAEELEYRHWLKNNIRQCTPKKLWRFWLWFLQPKTTNRSLAKYTIWYYIIDILIWYSQFFEFIEGEPEDDVETLIIRWRN